MKRKYLAFDIETATDVPGEDFNWKPHRPLGIACAAALASDTNKPIVWYGKNPDGSTAARMSQSEAALVVQELESRTAAGYTLLTWNGLGFDLDILSEESASFEQCKKLALDHVDMMFHVVCDRGYPVGLSKAADALKIKGKPDGMSGMLAPQLWIKKKYKDVLDYVAEDVRIAMEIATKCEDQRRLDWTTRKGTQSSMDLKKGWLTVRDAMRLPQPDTKWMSNPIPRSDFYEWFNANKLRRGAGS